jgi:hypothetical protein
MSSARERGGWLDIWLFLMLIGNIGALIWVAISSLVAATSSSGAFLNVPVAAGTIVLGVWNIICLTFIYKWKKLGFFGLTASSVALTGLNLYFGEGALSLLGLVGITILYFAMRPKWALFE